MKAIRLTPMSVGMACNNRRMMNGIMIEFAACHCRVRIALSGATWKGRGHDQLAFAGEPKSAGEGHQVSLGVGLQPIQTHHGEVGRAHLVVLEVDDLR